MHEQQLAKSIKIKTRVRQVCVPSPLLFNCVLDVMMQKSTNHRRGITLGLQDRLEDLAYADDMCFLSHSFSDMQSKLNLISETVKIARMKSNIRKTNTISLNVNTERKFLIYGKEIDNVESVPSAIWAV